MITAYFSTTFGDMFYRKKEGNPHEHLVCIHGSGGDSRLFVPLMNEMKSMTIYSADLPGHGRTKISQCSLDVYTQAMVQFINSLKGDIYVLGHSMGGGIIFELIKHNVAVKGAIFVATADKLPVNPVVFELLEKDFERLCQLAVELSYGKADESIRSAAVEYMKQAGCEIYKNDFMICNNYNYDEEAKKFPFPACFIANRKDKMVPLDTVYAAFKKMPNAVLNVLPYSGHMLHIEQCKHVAACIKTFAETAN